MKLLLNGGGGSKELKPTMNILNDIINYNKPLLYVPLAMDEEEHPYDECYEWFLNVTKDINVCRIDMVKSFEDFASCNLDDYSSIFIGGGNTFKLLKGIKDNGLFIKIKEFLNNDGIVIGASAGSVIFGKDISLIDVMDMNDVDLKDTKGFDCLNGISIFPHYKNTSSKLSEKENKTRTLNYTNAIKNFSKNVGKVIAIPEEDTIFINDNDIKVIGDKIYYEFVNGIDIKKEIDINLTIKEGYNYKEEIKELFEEYTNLIIEGDSTFKEYLSLQNYNQEIEHLEDKYGKPNGRLYIAFYGEKVAGCIALRKIDKKACEMKRLYVRDEFRGKHIGKELVNKIIVEARKIGYEYILLDTLPFLTSAIKMYKNLGFYEIDKYNDSPMDNTIYYRLDL